MADRTNPIRETDEEARLLARSLVEDARYAALAVNEAKGGSGVISYCLSTNLVMHLVCDTREMFTT